MLKFAMPALVLCALNGAVSSAAPEAAAPTHLTIGDGKAWSFPRGAWNDKEGAIYPPDQRNLHSRAFYKGATYTDFTAEFDYNANYRELGHGDAGLILRAGDNNHFYYVHFPWGGQQLRAKNFWAAISKVDGDGYIRNIGMALVPGLPSETDRWYHVKVAVKGKEIAVHVDGRPALSVSDSTYRSGAIGLAGYGWYSFRNFMVAGKSGRAPKWNDSLAVPRHTMEVGLNSQDMPTACVAPNGDILIASGTKIVRSTDKGRTWGTPETLPEKIGPLTDYGSTLFRTSKGRLIVMLYHGQDSVKKPVPEILISESPDSGRTWSDPQPSSVAAPWPDNPANLIPYGPILEGENGVLMRFLLGNSAAARITPNPFPNVITWGTTECKAFVIRSTDDGRNWSAPIEIDQPSWVGVQRGTVPGSLDLTEPTGVVMGKKVTVVVRPIYSSTMWQCWSYDGGLTWDSAARATFPGYAQSMARTKSGAILVAHRYPNYSVNISRDDGLSWDAGTIIDYPAWAMGFALEVEPDVLLCSYMNAEREQPLLLQRIRVKPDRIEPLITN